MFDEGSRRGYCVRWALALLALTAASGGVSACSAGQERQSASEDVSRATESLNGQITFDGCSGDEQALLQQGMDKLVRDVSLTPWPLEDCARDSSVSMDQGDSVEAILYKMRENKPTRIKCRDLSGTHKRAEAPRGVSREEVTVDHGLLAGAPSVAEIAATLIHEIAHNKGYAHPETAGQIGEIEYYETVPLILERCELEGQAVYHGRSTLTQEQELAHVGGPGGSYFESACQTDSFMTGIRVGADRFVRNLAPFCEQPNGQNAAQTTIVGPIGAGNASLQQCQPDEFMVGINGRSGAYVDALGVVCMKRVDVYKKWFGVERAFPAAGGTGGTPFARRCPAGMVVKRLLGRAGANIDQVRVVCEDPTVGDRGAFIRQGTPIGRPGGYEDEQHCNGYGAMIGLFGEYDDRIKRLGGICEPTRGTHVDTEHEHLTPGIDGGSGERRIEARCPADMALVGFEALAGARIDNINGICAKLDPWLLDATLFPGDVVNLTFLGFGGGGGQYHKEMCPRGQLVVGWQSWGGETDGVRGIRPVCRGMLDRPAPSGPLLPLNVVVNGGGSVNVSPVGVTCGANCTQHPFGSTVTLVPTSQPGFQFFGWSGDCTGNGACSVVMTNPHNVTALFEPVAPKPYHLTVTYRDDPECASSSGVLTFQPGGERCAFTGGSIVCSVGFDAGTNVTLSAISAFPSRFEGFNGDCTSTTSSCSLTMNGDKWVTATVCGLIP